TIYYGVFIHSLSARELQVLEHALVAVSGDGVIVWVEENVPPSAIAESSLSHGWDISEVEIVRTSEGEWIMPGFIDTHTHAPQFPNLGRGQEYQLLDWLECITFPTEARFSDVNYAKVAYESVISRTLNVGTTTSCYYATLHTESSKVLADIAHQKGMHFINTHRMLCCYAYCPSGQRAFIGKCNMDRNSPSNYIEESVEKSICGTRDLIEHISKLDSPSEIAKPGYFPLVQPIITPRFAISCTDELLSAMGKLFAERPPIPLQTHLSENTAEVSDTLKLFEHLNPPSDCLPPSHPKDKHTYTSVYDHFDLLDHRTILAHGVHLSEGELDLIVARKAGLSHCAGSNFNLRSGVASVGKWLDKGIKVGLGTDVSGGFAPSILNEIRHASIASKVRAMMDNPDSKKPSFRDPQGLSVPTLLYLATLGGASLCNLSDRVGSFVVGKEFDALFISLSKPTSKANPAIWHEAGKKEDFKIMLERFFFCGDDRNIRRVWVQGKLVGGVDKT
ncbi:Metallo-dependent hydrolase, partial [Cantharellus anzutake]|uniref:Metallo-dependent hydrolase n=1 Tax=Cantharellus anzutake TaxID=1750568 RepID=UPI001903108E